MQKIIKWNSKSELTGIGEIEKYLNEIIDKGYKIISVIPVEYSGGNYSYIYKALIIVEEGRKEKLDKLNKL